MNGKSIYYNSNDKGINRTYFNTNYDGKFSEKAYEPNEILAEWNEEISTIETFGNKLIKMKNNQEI